MDEELTVEQAIAMLPVGADRIHTFLNPGGVLIGADWNRADVVEAIRSALYRRPAGPTARRLGHNLTIWQGDEKGHWLFIQTKPDAELSPSDDR